MDKIDTATQTLRKQIAALTGGVSPTRHDYAYGYAQAVQDVLRILDAHPAPPAIADAPVSDRPGPDAVAEPFPTVTRERLREQIMADHDLDCEVRPSAFDPWPPCPFCGSTNLFKRTAVSPVSCRHCGAEGPAAEWRARWESRAAPDAVAEAAWSHFHPDHDAPPDPDTIVEGFCVVTGHWGQPCPASMVPWSGVNHVTVYRAAKGQQP